MRISAKMTGMGNFERHVKKLISKKSYEVPFKHVVMETARLARLYAPVAKVHRHEGMPTLEESIKVIKVGSKEYFIIADVPWASFMELGTKYFPVGDAESPRARTSTSGKACFHPFMRSAAYEMMNKFPEIAKKALFSTF